MTDRSSGMESWARRTIKVRAIRFGLAALVVVGVVASSMSMADASPRSSGVDPTARALLPANIKKSGVLIDGIQAPNPPMEYSKNGSSHWIGFDIDVVDAIAVKLGLKVTYDNQAFTQLIPSLETNRVQIVASGLSDLKTRESVANFIDYFKTGAQLFTSKANFPKASNWAALCGQTVEINIGTSYIPDVAQLSAKVCKGKSPIKDIIVGGTIADQELQIKTGRAIAAVTAPENVGYLSTVSPGDWVTIGPVFAPSYYGIAFAKSQVALFNAATRAFKDILQDGVYVQIAKRWHVTGSEVSKVMRNVG